MSGTSFGETGQIQTFTVLETGEYLISAEGATGGEDASDDAGGAGAEVTGQFALNAGDTIDIVVGGVGGQGHATDGGGGGGGSFVYDVTTGTLLEAAGGGGGAGEGPFTMSGAAGNAGQAGNATAGSNGGGVAGTTTTQAGAGDNPVGLTGDGNGNGYSYGGGGGGGFYVQGQSTQGVSQGAGGGGGESFLEILAGDNPADYGAGITNTSSYGAAGAAGGYGGGGGGQFFYGGGGGGGGYTGGGGGGVNPGPGGGGGSYDIGADAVMTSGVNTAGDGSVTVALDMTCFVSGTRILAEHREILVEDIRPGDRVITVRDAAAAFATVVWTGRRTVDISRHPEPDMVRPVCIMAGAVASGVPQRDLYVSPHHAVYLDGYLVEAVKLVNGVSIVQPARQGLVTYHHIALAAHDIILSEALPTETFLDSGNRGDFLAQETLTLYPEFVTPSQAARCAELIEDGAVFTALRERIARRARKVRIDRAA